jgi:hypothetical protein
MLVGNCSITLSNEDGYVDGIYAGHLVGVLSHKFDYNLDDRGRCPEVLSADYLCSGILS